VKRHVDSKGQTDFAADLDAVAADCAAFGEKALRAVSVSAFESHLDSETEILGLSDLNLGPRSDEKAAEMAEKLAEKRSNGLKIAIREAVFGSPIEVVSEKIEAILTENEASAAAETARNALGFVAKEAWLIAKDAAEQEIAA